MYKAIILAFMLKKKRNAVSIDSSIFASYVSKLLMQSLNKMKFQSLVAFSRLKSWWNYRRKKEGGTNDADME